MTTKADLIAQCKADNPKIIQVINGEQVELVSADYDKACADWADMKLAQTAINLALTKS